MSRISRDTHCSVLLERQRSVDSLWPIECLGGCCRCEEHQQSAWRQPLDKRSFFHLNFSHDLDGSSAAVLRSSTFFCNALSSRSVRNPLAGSRMSAARVCLNCR